MRVAEDIVTIAELKSDAAGVVKQLREARRPIIVTQRGKAAMVLLAPAEYDRLVNVHQIVEDLGQALVAADAGHLLAHDDVMHDVRLAVEEQVPSVATSRLSRLTSS